MKRTLWVDSCRFFAIFVIMCTHFLAEFYPQALLLWEEGLSSWLLYGLTGKFSVAFFFVLLGYFASRASNFKLPELLRYSLRRYIHFAFFVFLSTAAMIAACYCCTWLFHSPGPAAQRIIADGFRYNLIYLLRDSFLFENNYNSTLWCMQQLFLASILCRLLGCLPRRMGPAAAVFVMVVLLIMDAGFCIWICAAILGYVLRIVLENDRLCRRLSAPLPLCIMALAALLMIKLRLPEGALQYSLQSLAALLLIFIQFKFTPAQKLLACAPFPWLGSISMGLFVVHTPIYAILASSLYPVLLAFLAEGAALLLCYIAAVALSIFCAWLLHSLYGLISKK
ncbi:MAG: acyltransferase family protein [Oscillospiraceae bacterium]|nr:acyltransferase family protein [Oscillospiraceae bacterium]